MKNLFSIFTVALLLILTSCTKENLIQPEIAIAETDVQVEEDKTMHLTEKPSDPETGDFSVVNQLEVDKVSHAQFSNEIQVEFSTTHDFSSSVLEDTQYLGFVDNNGTESTLTFTVNNYNYVPGNLTVVFAIGTNNLAGLQLKELQYIIIQDTVIE